MKDKKVEKYRIFQQKYPRFIYEKYSWKISGTNNLEIFFDFKIGPNTYFKPKIVIKNIDKSAIKMVGSKVLKNLIFHLGLMEIPSYWKATCSPKIVIKTGRLNLKQIKWWQDLIMNGLGQFFYENKMKFQKPEFIISSTVNTANTAGSRRLSRSDINNLILVPVGGGKDSALTLEIFKKSKKNIQCFCLNPTKAALKIMKITGCGEPVIVRRIIDEKLLALNRQGFLNGHTPFSAYLAFLSVLVAAIFNQKYIAFSNERSSNEGNVKYLGKIINHQWSKSFDFEEKFREYSKKYLVKDVEYFSFLRPLYEIQIAKLFSNYPKYFPVFLSCNKAYKITSRIQKLTKEWCGKCPKCLFVFTILYPFVEKKELLNIFRKNLFAEKSLLPIMRELIGEWGFKPLECVGTQKESLVAFYLSWKKNRGPTPAKLPFLLEYFQKRILPKHPNLEIESKKIMNSWNNQHNLPKDFNKILQKEISKD